MNENKGINLIASILLAAFILLVVFAATARAQTGQGQFKGEFTFVVNGGSTIVPKPAVKPVVAPRPTTFTLKLDDLRQLLADARAAQPAFVTPAAVPVIVQAPTAPDMVEAARIQAAAQVEAARIAAQAVVEAAQIQKQIESLRVTAKKDELVSDLNNRLEVARISHGRLRDKILVALIGAGGRIGQGALTRTEISFGNIGNPSLSNIGNPSLSNIGNPSQVATLTGGDQTAILTGGNAQAVAAANATNLNISDDRWNYRGNGCYVTPFGVICYPKP